MLTGFYKRLLGPDFTWVPLAGGPDRILCAYIYRAGYSGRPMLSPTKAKAHFSGQEMLTREVAVRYIDSGGLEMLTEDMPRLTDAYASITQLRIIQTDIYDWIMTQDLPVEDLRCIDKLYTPSGATRDQIAKFLAKVAHAALPYSWG